MQQNTRRFTYNFFGGMQDLSPLSYIAGTLTGNPSLRVFSSNTSTLREITSAKQALADHSIAPIALQSKEHLGILNGTAFSASVAALALNEAVFLAVLAMITTAMGTEALGGVRGSYHYFIHDVARPHSGQVSDSCKQSPLRPNRKERSKQRVLFGTSLKEAPSPTTLKANAISTRTKDNSVKIATHYEHPLSF
jgi:histidine ammonia-lyase